MKFFSQKNKKLIPLLVLVLALGIILPFHFVHADFFDIVLAWLAKALASFSVVIIGFILSVFTYLTLPLVVAAAGMLNNLVSGKLLVGLSYTNNPIIDVGLNVTLPFANMFFILILVVIAFATILRIQNYALQKLLPTFIIIALLVNFMPVICGFIVDFSNLIMNFFVNNPNVPINGLSLFALTKDNIGAIWEAVGDIWGLPIDYKTINWGDTMMTLTNLVVGPLALGLVQIIFNLIATLVILMFFALFFLRYIMIWVLVIIAPVCLACYILPITKGAWNWWWNQFFQWAIIGIVGGFFLFLGVYVMANIDDSIKEPVPTCDPACGENQTCCNGTCKNLIPCNPKEPPGEELNDCEAQMGKGSICEKTIPFGSEGYCTCPSIGDTGWIGTALKAILPKTIPIALLLVGFFLSIKAGPMGAAAITGGAVALGALAAKKIKGTAKTVVGEPISKKVTEAQKNLFGAVSQKSNIRPIKRAAENLSLSAKEKLSKDIEKQQDTFKNMNASTRFAVLNPKDDKDVAAFVAATAERGDEDDILKGMSPDQRQEYEKLRERGLKYLEQTNPEAYKKALKKQPHWTINPDIKNKDYSPDSDRTINNFRRTSSKDIIEGNVGESYYRFLDLAEIAKIEDEQERENRGKQVKAIGKSFGINKLEAFASIEDDGLRKYAQQTIGKLLEGSGDQLSESAREYLYSEKGQTAWGGCINLQKIPKPSRLKAKEEEWAKKKAKKEAKKEEEAKAKAEAEAEAREKGRKRYTFGGTQFEMTDSGVFVPQSTRSSENPEATSKARSEGPESSPHSNETSHS